jgi:hypothetical protein
VMTTLGMFFPASARSADDPATTLAQ